MSKIAAAKGAADLPAGRVPSAPLGRITSAHGRFCCKSRRDGSGRYAFR